MQPKCQFCGKTILTEHYGITRQGFICVECLRRMKHEVHHIHISTNTGSNKTGKRNRYSGEVNEYA